LRKTAPLAMRWQATWPAILPLLVVPTLLVIAKGSLWPEVIGYHALCLGLPLVYRHGLTKAGFTVSNARRWLPLAGAVSIAVLAAGEVGRHVNLVTLRPAGWERVLSLAHPWWAFVVYSILVNAFCEEYLWRGFLLPRTGIALGGVLFWLMHAAAATVFVNAFAATWLTVPTLFAGLIWGWMRQRFGSLWPAFLTHLAADVAILRVATMLVRA
jgi:membrane protease YdiL (CAAX protease family)